MLYFHRRRFMPMSRPRLMPMLMVLAVIVIAAGMGLVWWYKGLIESAINP